MGVVPAPGAGSGSCPTWIARVSNSMRRILGKPHPLGAEDSGEARERLVQARRVAPGPEHLERLRLPVEAPDAAYEAVADEDREHVVPELPLHHLSLSERDRARRLRHSRASMPELSPQALRSG